MFTAGSLGCIEIRLPIFGNRILVFGGSRLADSLHVALDAILNPREVLLVRDEAELLHQVWQNALSVDEPDVVVPVLTDRLVQLPERLFELHVSLRRPASYGDREYSWVGGIVAISTDGAAIAELDCHPLFAGLSGHRAVGPPIHVVDVVGAIRGVGPLFPRAWGLVLSRCGLAVFWRYFNDAEKSLQARDFGACKQQLLEAMTELVDRHALRQLLPHTRTTSAIGRIRRRVMAIAEDATNTPLALSDALAETRTIMAAYQLDFGD